MLRFSLPALLLVLAALPPAPAAASSLPADTLTRYQWRQSWFSRDKAYHFALSAAGSAGVYALARELGLGRRASVLTAAVVAGTAGVLREVIGPDPDNRVTGQFFSRRDLVWDGAGIVVGISLTELLFGSRWSRDGSGP